MLVCHDLHAAFLYFVVYQFWYLEKNGLSYFHTIVSGMIDYKEFRNALFPRENMVRETTDWNLFKNRERIKLVELYKDNASVIREPHTLSVT